jgi:hypothetical protein
MKLNDTVNFIEPIGQDGIEGWYEGPGAIDYGDKTLTGIQFYYVVKEDVSGDFTPAT